MQVPPISLPVWRTTDVLVVGSTTAAVSGALSAREAGRNVVLAGDENYLGQDLGGDLHLWEQNSNDPLVQQAMKACEEAPARPAALKRALEHRLLAAAIPFLYGVRPVGLLRDKGTRIHGVIFAARTSLFVILCDQVIDASPFGLGLRLAECPLSPRIADRIGWRVLASKEPIGWPGEIQSLPTPYRQVLKDGEMSYAGFELSISRSGLTSTPMGMEHILRASLVDEAVWFAASHLIDPGIDELAGASRRESIHDLTDADLAVGDGIWNASRLSAVADLSGLTDPSAMSNLGRRTGKLAASHVRSRVEADLIFHSGNGATGNFAFSPAFLRNSGTSVQVEALSFPDWESVDVLVAGGGTGGAPAAIAAARAGAKTLCLESAHGLGGVGTTGLISSYWFGNKVGFTEELNGRVSAADSLSQSKKGNGWRPEVKSAIYHRMLQEAGGTAWMGSFAFGARLVGNRPDGLLVSTPFGCGFVKAKTIVDATGNADLAAACGAECRQIGSQHVAVQGTGISPRVHPGVPHQNSDHTFIEENDPEGITAAHVQAREKYSNDFETAPFVNSRERRQIVGDFEISPLDILAGRTFPDTIFTASSNFDTHGFIVHPVFMVAPPDHKPLQAHVPLRCMIPRGIEGLLVTGLGMSAHRDALPVIRMQADVQNQGYAAGLLAAQTAQSGQNFGDIDVKAFQQQLVTQGIISNATALDEDSFPLPAEAIAEAALGDLRNAKNVAILFAHPEVSRQQLIDVMQMDADPARRETAALILGLMGAPQAAGPLLEYLSRATWDEGWNYRGMGQFGASMSPLDAQIIALGRCGTADAVAPLIRLVGELNGDAAFSHCRAVALASAMLKDADLTLALAGLLDLPGLCGHAFDTMEDLLTDTDGDPTSTRSRNLALRELYLARGLYLAGDINERGRQILESYTHDLRGHFARHATAVLATASSEPDNHLELA